MSQRHTYSSVTAFVPGRVDKEGGIIRGVSVMTVGPALGHTYKAEDGKELPVFIDQTTLEQTKACAETYSGGVKVKADHRSGIFDVTGYLRNFRIEGDVLRADLHILATDDNRDKLLEMAETIPDTFGLSVFTVGPYDVKNGMALDRCTEILSCDLVTEPAANPQGLFERGAEDTAKSAEGVIAGFVEKVQKHFAATKSKSKAMSLAISEDGKGYETWMSTGKSMSYETKTAQPEEKTMSDDLTEAQCAELARLPKLEKLDPDELIGVSLKQVALLSGIPCNSAAFFLEAEKVFPAIKNSSVYRAGDLLAFAQRHRARTALRLAWSTGDKAAVADALVAAVKFSNPPKT